MKRKYGYWLFTCALVGVSCFAGYEYTRAKKMENIVGSTYNRAFFELNDYVDDINSLLSKSLAVNSPVHFASISAELSRQSAAAKECLSQLPIGEVSLEKTEKFLSQVGDYSFYLSKNSLNDIEISKEDFDTLSSLNTYAENLSAVLNSLQEDIYNNRLDFVKDSNKMATVAYAANTSLDGFEAIEKEFGEYPSLIYDGPFSEHMDNREAVMLQGAKEITPQEAAIKANEFLGRNSGFISYQGNSENSHIDYYSFSARNNETTIAVTKKGGYILYYLNSRPVEKEVISMQDATAKASEFLKSHGFENMKQSYYEKHDSTATINFAYEQNGVVCYSDLIKVKVALDDGQIVGLESNGYLTNHKTRENLTASVSTQEARSKVSPHLSIDQARLTLIPKDSMREVLCYEFKATLNNKNYLVYINAQDLKEEEIFMLIESPEGILTV